MADQGLLLNAIIYLAAAVVAVPLFKRVGLGSVLGYLAAGVAIGPWGFGLICNVDDILHFAEFGVVLLLFLIGLELNPQRLWALRRPILGLGGAQVAATTALIGAVAMLLGADWRAALVAGMGLALSSTAIALQVLAERNRLGTPEGSAGFSILLFQDVAVVPMLAVIPLLAGEGGEADVGWLRALQVVGVIVAIVVGGRFVLRPLFRVIAATGVREIFTAFSLLLVIGTAVLMQAVGLSMALGTFLAGVLLAESEYRHALESDIEPFKGLLLGLFFISVGMSVDVGLILAQPARFALLVSGLVGLKAAVLLALARLYGLPRAQHARFAIVLAQGGEFAFVLFSVAAAGVLSLDLSRLLIGVVVLSMMTTPLLLALIERLLEPRLARSAERPSDTIDEPQQPVLIAGFGRFGQTVGRLLHANGVGTTILDHDPEIIETLGPLGFKVFYGDAGRLDLLRAAGAEHARLLVLAVDDRDQSLRIVEIVRAHFPNLAVLCRARDMVHSFELLERGVLDVEREVFEAALRLGEEALRRLGFSDWQAGHAADLYRAHDRKLLAELYRHFRADPEVRISISKSARERLREQMQRDEAFFTTPGGDA
jgi:glutathione-regulated potassium-efflux system ancillary protein KefC